MLHALSRDSISGFIQVTPMQAVTLTARYWPDVIVNCPNGRFGRSRLRTTIPCKGFAQ